MKVLVLGNGKLGQEIINQTGWDYLSKNKDNINVLDFDSWSNKLDGYDVILNCIANTNTYSDDHKLMTEVNFKFVLDLVSECNKRSIKLIHISTDYVYANSNNNAKETDQELPDRNHYSVTKYYADNYIKMFSNNYLICRLSHKPKPFPYDSAWTNVMTNADYTDVISSLVIELIRKDAKGLYNVGTDQKTIYDLAKQTNPSVKESLAPTHIPKNVTMDLTKMKEFLNK